MPILFLTLLVAATYLDLPIARLFFHKGNVFFDLLYNYGEYPALITCYGSALLFLLSFAITKLQTFRPLFLYLIATLAVGSFLINEKLLKEHWGRPRPRQVVEFGGEHPFRPFYKPNFFEKSQTKSFACGHCTAGFYFFALARAARKRWLMGFALLFGTALGVARIAQGGHFFSDVIVGAMIMWYTAQAFEWLIKEKREQIA